MKITCENKSFIFLLIVLADKQETKRHLQSNTNRHLTTKIPIIQ